MFLLEEVKPEGAKYCPYVADFYSIIPKKPYCANDKYYCCIKDKLCALKYPYIQPNHPAVVSCLVYDIDQDQAVFAYHDNNAPRPQIITKNPKNGHAHYYYLLTEKVGLWGKSSTKAIKYLDSVHRALRCKLGADPNYIGNLIKTPTHPSWQTYTTGAQKSYTLGELADWLDLTEPKKLVVANNEHYLGRNHEIFEHTRVQAYKIASQHNFGGLYEAVLTIAQDENSKFNNPLMPNELTHIARSITRFCKSPRFGTYSKHSETRFSELQAHRGRLGAVKANAQSQACSKGGLARSAGFGYQRQRALKLFVEGRTVTQIAKELGCHRSSVTRWLSNL